MSDGLKYFIAIIFATIGFLIGYFLIVRYIKQPISKPYLIIAIVFLLSIGLAVLLIIFWTINGYSLSIIGFLIGIATGISVYIIKTKLSKKVPGKLEDDRIDL